MNYNDIIMLSLHDDEREMWSSVDRISAFLERLKEHHPDETREFLKEEYEALNGKHLNETAARMVVSEMYHGERDGVNAKIVKGEVVSEQDAIKLLEGMSEDEEDANKWDAYAAANGFMHDLAATGMTRDAVMKAAKHFWFHDDDFSDGGKVYWYYSRMLFQ